MTNSAYDVFRNALLDGDYALSTDVIKVTLGNDTSATGFTQTHATIGAVNTAGKLINYTDTTGTATVTPTTTGGTVGQFDSSGSPSITPSDNPTTVKSLILWNDTVTDEPMLFFDTGTGLGATGTGLSGGAIQITWSASGIFVLG